VTGSAWRPKGACTVSCLDWGSLISAVSLTFTAPILSLSRSWRRLGKGWKRLEPKAVGGSWCSRTNGLTTVNRLCRTLTKPKGVECREVVSRSRSSAVRGRQPFAERSHASDTPTRVTATVDPFNGRSLQRSIPSTVDPFNGRVVFAQGSKLGVKALVAFYRTVCEAYPEAERTRGRTDQRPNGSIWCRTTGPFTSIPTYSSLSNLKRLRSASEDLPPVRRPPTWTKDPSAAARKKWGDWNRPIQLVTLPTYASWTNPIEKLWRWAKQKVLHLPPWADDLPLLRSRVAAFLEGFAHGSADLLRDLGLSDLDLLYPAISRSKGRDPGLPD
jgi:hypothetical protein